MRLLPSRFHFLSLTVALFGSALGCGSGDDGPLSFGPEDGSGGSGGDAGVVEDSGSGGGGGDGQCKSSADCDDGIPCTIDTCAFGACRHVPGPNEGATACPASQLCEVGKGCVPGVACSDDDVCKAQFGDDPCKADIRCDASSAICRYSILDKDGDGHAPLVCGGGDCNDADPLVFPDAKERCNGLDDNCNGAKDDGATCAGGGVCDEGLCACPPANLCHGACIDYETDFSHCGGCDKACKAGEACQSGQCVPSSSCKGPGLFVMQDVSGSMPDAGKWDAAKQGIEAFAKLPASVGLYMGIGYHPVAAPGSIPSSCQTEADCGQYGPCLFNICLGNPGGGSVDSCQASDYSKPAVAMAKLPDNAEAIATSLAAITIAGGSMLTAPLRGSVDYARGWAQANGGHPVAVVLVTDNLPNTCSDTLASAVEAAQEGLSASPQVKTFVIKMDGADGTEAGWQSLASAGGTTAARTVKTAVNMRAALEAIRNELPGCP